MVPAIGDQVELQAVQKRISEATQVGSCTFSSRLINQCVCVCVCRAADNSSIFFGLLSIQNLFVRILVIYQCPVKINVKCPVKLNIEWT